MHGASPVTLPAPRMNIVGEFISIGGNRNPAAADWDTEGSGYLAFGADNSIALWDPLVGIKHIVSVATSKRILILTRMVASAVSGC